MAILALAPATSATGAPRSTPETGVGTSEPASPTPLNGPVGVDPVRRTAGPEVYGPPVWIPLRTDLDGGEVTVGCTYHSHGSEFGYECSGHHDRWAIDFVATTGTSVYAAGAGFATNLTGKPGGSGFGNVVKVDHGFGITTLYAHLASVAIPAEGAWVDETTLLGTVGSTGSSSTPHLHFERRALPYGVTDPFGDVAADPGPLYACRMGMLVTYPQVAGHDTWEGTAWGAFSVASQGPDCTDARQPSATDGAATDVPTLADRIRAMLLRFSHAQGWSALSG